MTRTGLFETGSERATGTGTYAVAWTMLFMKK
jgi:hypothetical protein